jgi:hypothetical protein
MPQDASTVIGGPAIITFNTATFYSEGPVEVRVSKEYKRRTIGGFGSIPAKITDVKAEITFTPSQYKNTNIMFPYFASAMGTRIFGNTDKPIVIQSMTEALKYTWSRGAVLKSPAFGFGVKKNLLGQMTLTAIKANATELSGATSVVQITDPSAFADTSFDVTKLFDIHYTMSWGGAPFAAIETEDGVDVETEYDLAPVMLDGAMVDMKLQDVRMRASFIPANLTHANLLTLAKVQGIDRGTSLSPTGANDLVISGIATGDPKLTLVKAYVTDIGHRFSMSDHLANTFTMEAARTFTTGAANAIATLTTVP